MNKVYIYTLATAEEPHNIRYVGKANDICKRLIRHLQPYYLNQSDYKARWLKKILKEGKTPIIEILDEVTVEDWEILEQYWIQQMRAWGYNLTNLAQGGEGVNWTGKKHSLESRHKMRLNSPTSRPVIQYDLSGNIINEFISLSEATEKSGCHIFLISNCCNKKQYYTVNGTTFRFKDDAFDYIPYNKHIQKNSKSICQYDLKGNLIHIYDSIKQAAAVLNLTDSNISRCLQGKPYCNTAGGYIWKYINEKFAPVTKKKMIIPQCKFPVIQIDKNNNTVGIFESISDAARKTGYSKSQIAECVKGIRSKSVRGYIFKKQ